MESTSQVATPEELPVIDISPLYGTDPSKKARVAQQIRAACLTVGFFYVTGHTVTPDQHNQLLQCTTDLFTLPVGVKDSIAANLSPLHRGYTGLGGSHNCTQEDGSFDNKESFLLGAEGSASPMHGPNQWPPADLLPSWKDNVHGYFAAVLELSRTIAGGLALSLSLPEDFFEDKTRDPVAQLLLLSYPPPPERAAAATAGTTAHGAVNGSGSCSASSSGRNLGCGAHTDCGFLTILTQDEVPGLEVRLASGSWVQAPVIPGAFLVNLGDMMAHWSNDVYKSTEHRVFNHSSTARHSAVFFCNCDFSALVEPILTEAGQTAADAKYSPIKAGRYIMEKLGLMWDQ